MACVNPNNEEFKKLLKEIGNPLLAEIEFDKRFSSEEFQQKKGTESSKASPRTIALVKELLQKMGIEFKEMSSLVVNGKKIEANGVADITRKLIQVLDGKDAEVLPEEAMHFVVEIIQQKDPNLFKQLLSEINDYSLLKKVYEQYGTDKNYQTNGKPDILKLKKEAIAKVLAETIIKKAEGITEKPELLDKARVWWKRILDAIRGYFFSTGMDKLALDIISGKFEGKAEDIRTEQEQLYLQKTQQEIIYDELKNTKNYVHKIEDDKTKESWYEVNGEKKPRVHDVIKSWYDNMKEDLTKSEFDKAIDDVYKNEGTFGHFLMETLFDLYIDGETGKKRETPKDDSAFLATIDERYLDVYKLLKENFEKRLAQYDDGTKFLSEVIVYDPNRRVKGVKGQGLAGTIDFLAILPDGKVDVLDWKFFQLNTERYTDIPWYKTKEWEQQMTQYKLILNKGYGIKMEDFRYTRMIPIQAIYTKADYEEKIAPELSEIKIGDVVVKNIEEDYLLPYATRDEKTGNDDIDMWVDRLNEIYNSLHLKQVKTEEERKLKNEQLNEILRAIRHLQIKQSVGPLIYQAQLLNRQVALTIKTYEEKYKGKDPSTFSEEELNDFSKECEEFIRDIAKYVNLDIELKSSFPKEMSEEDKKTYESLRDAASDAREYYMQLKKAYDDYIINTIGKKESVDLSKPERVIKGFARWFSTTSIMQTAAIQLLYKKASKMFTYAAYETETQIRKLEALEKDFVKWASDKGLTAKDRFRLIKKKGKNELIDEFSPEFYKELKQKIKEADFEWIKNNIDVAAYREHIQKVKKEKLEEIRKKPIVNKEDIKRFEETGEIPLSYRKEQQKILNLYDLAEESSPGWLLYEELKQFPSRSKWESKEWKELNSPENAAAKAFYDYIIERNQEYYKIGYIKNPRTFLPFIQKNLVEKMVTGGHMTLGEGFLQSISVDEEQVGYGKRDSSGELIDVVPRYFVTPSEGELSEDLFRNISLFNEAALRYKYITTIDGQVRSILRLERNKKSIVTSMFGKTRIENGQIKTEESNSDNAKLYQDMMRSIVYGQKYLQSETFDQLLVKIGSWGETLNKKLGVDIFPKNLSERQISFNKSIDTLNNHFQLVTLGINGLSALSNFVGGTLQSIVNSGKYFTKTNWVSSEIKLTTNVFSTEEKKKFLSAVRYFLPLTENYNKQLTDALSLNAMQPDVVQNTLMLLMRTSDRAVQLTNFLAYVSNTIVMDGKLLNVREHLRQTDKYSDRYSVSSEDRKKLDDSFEKDVDDLLKEKGLMSLAEYREGELFIPGVDRMSDTVVEFRRKVQQLNKDALGNLTDDDVRLINANIYGRSFMVFKNWIPRPLDVRFGSLKYNSASDAYEWGRTRTIFRLLSNDFVDKLDGLKSAILGNDDKYVKQILALYEYKKAEYERNTGKEFTMTRNDFIDMVKQNVRNQMYDALFLASLITLALLAKALPDDDDEDAVKNQYRYMAKALDKFKDELMYFYDVTSLTNFVSKGIFPSISLLDNIRKGISNFMVENWAIVVGDEKKEKDTKVIKYWLKSFPFTNQMTGYLPLFYPELAKDLGIKMQSNYGIR